MDCAASLASGGGVRVQCYKHWLQLLQRLSGSPPFTLLNPEGVTQGDPILMVLYRVTLVPLVE